MEVRFRSRSLARQAEDERAAARAFGPLVGRRYIQRIQILRSVSGFAALRGIVALRLHRLRGDRSGQWAVNLTGFARLIITYDDESQTIWIEDVSKHYGD